MTPERDTSKKKTSRRRIHITAQHLIRQLALRFDAAQIQEHLQTREDIKGRVPSLRTIQRLVKHYREQDLSGPWSLADADDEDAALIMPVLAEALDWSRGRDFHLTRDQAAWITRVRSAAPDLAPVWALATAQEYQWRAQDKAHTADLDAFLAFAPWRGQDEMHRFAKWVGRVQPEWAGEPGKVTRWDGDERWEIHFPLRADGVAMAFVIAQHLDLLWEPFEGPKNEHFSRRAHGEFIVLTEAAGGQSYVRQGSDWYFSKDKEGQS